MKRVVLLNLFLLVTVWANAQQFGGNPPAIKWNQVNTPPGRIIFPAGLDSSARQIADIILRMNKAIQPTIGNRQNQISIVLQNQTIEPNAYVGLAPFRSEFYLTPEQNSFDIGSLPWPKQLAIHEFRHVQQYNNFNIGVSHVMRVLFGEGGQALANEIAIPNWFFEGDAVFNETLVSEQGRGRLPYFFNGYRALWAAGKNYSWQKLRNGSFLDYTPDWYPTGYMLVAYGREKYGDLFWKNVTHNAAAYSGGFYPLQRAVKKYSGEDFKQFRNSGINYFKRQFTKDGNSTEPVGSHFVADEEFPAYVNDSTLVYMKSAYNRLPEFVVRGRNTEHSIRVRSISLDKYFAYQNGKLLYTSYRPDLRWNYRNYSEIQLLDIITGEQRRLTVRTKYFSPDFSADGKRIVAAEEAPNGKCRLHILDAVSGKLLNVVPNAEELFYTYPKFYGDDKVIAAVRNKTGKMSLAVIDIKTGSASYLLHFTYQPIGFIKLQGDVVFFTATSGANDRLYSLSVADHKLYELQNNTINASIGHYQPAIGDQHLAWVGLTAAGFHITEIDKQNAEWKLIGATSVPGALTNFGVKVLEHDSASNLLAGVKDLPLPVTKYHKGYHLFNFHSLIPNFNDPNYAVALVGENVLNTFQSQLSVNYNRDEGYKEAGFDAIYGALFPYFSAGANYILDRRAFDGSKNIYWNETNLHGGVELPLNLSADRLYTSLSIGTDIYYTKINFQQAYRSLFADKSYAYLNHYITFSNNIQQAKQHIYPRLAQSVSLNYKEGIINSSSDQFLANVYLYFPGLMLNHNLVINAAHQQRNSGNSVISFSNDFPFSRGYTAENLHDMNKLGVNYHLPLVYPDAGAADLVYLLRLRGNLFYDHTYATDHYTNGLQFKGTFRSTGAELYFDTQWFNQSPVTFGFRYSRLLDNDFFGGNGRNRFEVIVPVTIL